MKGEMFVFPLLPVFLISLIGLLLYRKTVEISFPSLLKYRDGRMIANGAASILWDVSLLFSLYLYWYQGTAFGVIAPYLFSGIIFSLIGWCDDLLEFKVKAKFKLQLCGAFACVLIFSVFREVSFREKILLFFLLIFMVNAFNLLDISDGLLTGLCLCILPGLLIIYPETLLKGYFFCWIAGLSALFVLNAYRPIVFAGDAGAHLFGALQALFIVDHLFSSFNYEEAGKIFILYSLVLFDFFFVFFLRIYRKRSPFLKSEDHLAFVLKRKIKSNKITLFIYLALQSVLLIILAF